MDSKVYNDIDSSLGYHTEYSHYPKNPLLRECPQLQLATSDLSTCPVILPFFRLASFLE